MSRCRPARSSADGGRMWAPGCGIPPITRGRCRRPRRVMFFYHCAFCQQNVWAFGVEHYATQGQNNLTDGPRGTQHIQAIVNENDMLVGGALQRGFTGAGSYGSFPGAEERDLRDVE